jgi:hypothetical protein
MVVISQLFNRQTGSGLTKNQRIVFILFCIVVAFLIPDTMINYVSDFIYPQLVTLWGVAFFVTIAGVAILGQYCLVEFVKRRSREIRAKDPYLKWIHKIAGGALWALAAIVILVIFEILVTSQYHTALLVTAMAINLIFTISILSLFAKKLFSWFRSNRNSLVVLLYGASFAGSAFSLGILVTYNFSVFQQKQQIITPAYEVVFPYDVLEPGSVLATLFESYRYVDLVSFGLLISATALLLRHYSKRLGKVKFWIVICLPLLYYFTTFLEQLGIYAPVTDAEWFNWYLYMSLNSTAGGILFGLAFLSIARTIREDSPVKNYMIIAAYGLVLLFISNQVTLNATSYPPFGLATQSFLILSSYMIFLGLYSTAISISQDNKLRASIRKFATQDSNLLSSIGTAHMEQEIQKTVNSMKNVVQEQEKELEEQTGIEANLEEDEMKKYLEEVMQEVGKAKKPST